jgi:hypothetical protein
MDEKPRSATRRPVLPAAERLEARLLLDGGQVSGQVWLDQDGDGVRGPFDSPIDGITVQLLDAGTHQVLDVATTESTDRDGDGQVDPLAEQGSYRFAELPLGRYELGIVAPPEWSQTNPAPAYHVAQTQIDTLHTPNILTFEFAGASVPDGDATLTITAEADLDQTSEFLRIEVEGEVLADCFVHGGLQYQPVEAVLAIGQLQLAEWVTDGVVSVRVLPTADVTDLTGAERITVELAYEATGRHAVVIATAQAVEGRDFGLSPPYVNVPPTLTAIEPLAGGREDEAFLIDYDALLAASDAADPNGQAVTFRVESVVRGTLRKAGQPVQPGLTLLGPGERLLWRPPADDHGTLEAFGVSAWDGQEASAMTAAVSVIVAAVNDPPTLSAVATLDGALADLPFAISHANLAAAAGAADVEGDALSFRIESVSAGALAKDGQDVAPGSTLLAAGECLTWQPPARQHGAIEAFRIVAWDGQDASTPPVAVWVNVASENRPPSLSAVQTLTGAREDADFAIPYAMLAAAADAGDADGQVIHFRVEAVGAGTLMEGAQAVVAGQTLLSPGEALTWRGPAEAFGALEAFTLRAWDGYAASAGAAAVWIDVAAVNDDPVAGDDAAAADEDTPVTTPNVLANDTDIDGDALAVWTFTQPAHGSAVYHGDGTFTYTPAAGFHGDDGFTYTVADGRGGQDVATVTLTVAPVNDPPHAAADDAATDEDTPVAIPNVLANDSDPEGEPLRVAAFTQPAHGSAVYHGDGAFTYTPAADFNGLDEFAYTLADAGGAEGTAAVTIHVAPVNDPPTAHDGQADAASGKTVRIALAGSDVETDAALLRFAIAAPPAHGAVWLDDSEAVYTPAADYTGPDGFSFTVTDRGDGASPERTSAAASVAIEVRRPLAAIPMGDLASSLLYTDADGTRVRLSLRSGGAFEAFFRGEDVRYGLVGRTIVVTGRGLLLEELVLRDTTARTALALRTDRGGDGRAELGGLFVFGAIRSVSAPTADLVGELSVTGLAAKLVLGDVSGGCLAVNAAGGAVGSRDALTLSLGRVADCSLDTHGLAIRSLTATEWLDSDGGDEVRAPWLGRLAIRGCRANARRGIEGSAGDFQADVILSGAGLAGRARTLGAARVAGSVCGSAWDVTGPAGSVRIVGDVSGWNLIVRDAPGDARRAGGLRTLSLGSVQAAAVDVADALGAVRALRWDAGGLSADSIGTVRVTGRRSAGVRGDFGAAVTIRGKRLPAGRLALRSATIYGDLTDSAWHVGGDAGRLTVLGAASGSTVRADGSITAITLGAADGSDFLAGVAEGAGRHADDEADFADRGAAIGTIRIRGLPTARGEPIPRFLSDSNFSAAAVRIASLLNAAGGEEACGLFTLAGDGAGIRLLRYRDTLTREGFLWRPGQPLPHVGALVIEML